MEQHLNNFKNCLEKEIPFCEVECPFHLDVRNFIEKMKRGGMRGAFKTYRDAVGFPLIASNLCHEPCKEGCPGKDADSSIELLLLEKACICFSEDRVPTDYNLPKKKKKIAVIGAGISGLACALRLCMKKYDVEIFEASDRIGGALWNLMDPDIFMQDIEEQFRNETYLLHLNTRITSMEDLAEGGFDAVYAATGQGGNGFGLLSAAAVDSGLDPCKTEKTPDKNCACYGSTGWFAGGGLVGDAPVYALANGLSMGTVIDNFLKTGNLLNPDNVRKTGMCPGLAGKQIGVSVKPENGANYSKEEAKREAERCLECQCDFCRTHCDLTEFYNKWPLRIKDEILATTLPGSAEVKATPAKRLLSTCSQCGLCRETCPKEIDLGALILEGRKSMHRQKKAPWVFHDFWLRDMDFANSEHASITRDAGGKCAYAFFPGCQLGASDPVLVERTYAYLRDKQPDTGLMLRCCGAPAEWSGDEERFACETERIRTLWEGLGKPKMILACPTCVKKFKTYLSEIPVISLYEIIAVWGVESAAPNQSEQHIRPHSLSQRTYSVFDACAARNEGEMRESVRILAENAGCRLEPLQGNEANAHCCGYGGHPGIANPQFAEFVTRKRISESDNPYVTYCINCRDVFVDAGKEAVHILEILFGGESEPRKQATLTGRRENRIKLQRNLLKEFWNIDSEEKKKECGVNVRISEDLAKKLSRRRILEEEAVSVLSFCERTGRRVYHPEKETYSGYRESGHMTCWVEYKKEAEPESYALINAYVHRMKIELEPVWKGTKIEPVR